MTKIALFSDIHGNLQALDAVLKDIKRQEIDDLIFLGDAATLGPQPKEVIARLSQLNCQYVRGNHDAFITAQDSVESYTKQLEIITLVNWCAAQLSTTEIEFLKSFHSRITVPLQDGNSLLCFHGTPDSHNENIYPDISDSDLQTLLNPYSDSIYACGHTHLPIIRRLGGKLVLNTGSVGAAFLEKPLNGPPRIVPWAEYIVLEYRGKTPEATLKRVEYDMNAFQEALYNSEMPGKENWLDYWVSKK